MMGLIKKLEIEEWPENQISRFWVHVITNGLGEAIRVPVFLARGAKPGPVMGITAAIHGNELNGISVIQRIFSKIDTNKLSGSIVGVLALNIPGVLMGVRNFNDGSDLNRIAPGNAKGDQGSIYVHRLLTKIIERFDYLIDLHTASFGRRNSYYIRADMSDPLAARMAVLQGPDIILNNAPSEKSMRGAATQRGIKGITIELRDPNLFQRDVILDAVSGIQNLMMDLGFIEGQPTCPIEEAILCQDSYWMYTDEGGILHVLPKINDRVKKGELIAKVTSVFGEPLKEFYSENDGIVIGKSVNPINQTGSRILHLGLKPEVIPCVL